MTEDRLRTLGLAVFGVVVALVPVALALASGLSGRPALVDDTFELKIGLLLIMSVVAATSLVLTWLRPRNSVGWLLGLSAALGVVCEVGQAYGARSLSDPASPLPLGRWVLSWSAPLWIPALMLPATLLLARYPSGRLAGPWARRVDRTVCVAFVAVWVGYAGSLQSVTDVVDGARPPYSLPEPLGVVLAVGALLTLVACMLAVAAMTLRRLLHAGWPERQQLALLLPPVTLTVALVMLTPWNTVSSAAFASLPVAIAVGVLKYRLLGIEVVVRRALLYGALTGLVLVVFVAVTSALASLVPDGPAPEVVAATVVAVVLVPARERLQGLVDRLVYGDRRDPWRALTRLGKEAADGNALPEVVAAVAQSLCLPGAQVRGSDGTTATWGEVGADARVVPLCVGEEAVGELRVAPRRGERTLSRADDRLLQALAPLVALVLRSAALAAALRVEQERVVQTREAERARLRRDLHDGLGPSLTGIGLGLEAVDTTGLPDRSRPVVARLRAEASASLEEVRRILEDLRPGALETRGLLAVLRARAEHLTDTTPVRVDVVAPEALELPDDVESAALRIVEEALTNVVRHARATHCTVTVSCDDVLRVEIRDDGVGFAGARPGGVGVPSMRSRATALGGRLDVAAQNGTSVAVEIPLTVRGEVPA